MGSAVHEPLNVSTEEGFLRGPCCRDPRASVDLQELGGCGITGWVGLKAKNEERGRGEASSL